MPAYAWGGLRLIADLPLPGVPEAPDTLSVAWRVDAAAGVRSEDRSARWFHRWLLPDNRSWLSFARAGDGYLLRFEDLTTFLVRPAAREILCDAGTTPPDTFAHLLLDHVLPLVAGGRDRLALHGSVVAMDGGAVGFLGKSGRGKSTLAAAFARQGFEVLSDDCCLLHRAAGGLDVLPTYPGLRLAAPMADRLRSPSDPPPQPVAHYSTKHRVAAPGAPPWDPRPRPLGALYLLDHGAHGADDDLSIARVSTRDAVLAIVGVTFCLDVEDRELVRWGFDLAAQAAGGDAVKALGFPRRFAALEEVVPAIIADRRR